MKSLERNDINGSCSSFIASFRSTMTLRAAALSDRRAAASMCVYRGRRGAVIITATTIDHKVEAAGQFERPSNDAARRRR